MRKIKAVIGVIIGLAVYFVLGWALNDSALGPKLIGAGVLLWLVSSYVFGGALVLWWVLWFLNPKVDAHSLDERVDRRRYN